MRNNDTPLEGFLTGGTNMAKRNNKWTQKKYDVFMKNKSWELSGKDYIPTLTINTFSSRGRVTRIKGWKTGRVHYIHSDIMLRYFYILDYTDKVIINEEEYNIVDIREHFPLYDLDQMEDVKSLKLDKFREKDSGVSYILSSTFLITLANKFETKYIARAVRAKSSLSRKITLEKLEIERRYWKSKGVNFGVVTEKDYSRAYADNIAWFHTVRESNEDYGLSIKQIRVLSKVFCKDVVLVNQQLIVFLHNFEEKFELNSGSGLLIFKYLLSIKRIEVDMYKKIDILKLTSNSIKVVNLSD